jgi:hypothetical protein
MSHPSRVTPLARCLFLSTFTLGVIVACTDAPTASPTRSAPAEARLAKVSDWGPYTALFDDATTNKVRSDGRGIYRDAADCVHSATLPGGAYLFRTIENTTECKALVRGTWRFFTIDFGTPSIDLDQDTIPEAVEFAPGRILADNAFANRATSTPVRIFIHEVFADGSTSQNHKWLITYRNNVAVSGTTTRILQAFPGNAKADVSDLAGVIVLSNVDLPFKLSLTKQ